MECWWIRSAWGGGEGGEGRGVDRGERLHSLRISCESAARLRRNAIKTFHHTVVCVTTFTMPVH